MTAGTPTGTPQPETGRQPTSGDQPSVPLLTPRDGLPPVTSSPDEVREIAARFASASGPVAIDAERASGYRYGASAYLVQLRRAGAGTALIDPIAVPDLAELGAALDTTEWVLHAASQDLACLAELGLTPPRLFDTELAGRLLGYPRVALGTLVEELLGFHLEKGHSAADWSTRPLPEPWLRYAALDVELLVELRDVLADQLVRAGKSAWAAEEFEALRTAPPPATREDPWRRTSGLHQIRKSRQLAVVRELWLRRDRIAQRRNLAPGRVLPDSAIVQAALNVPATIEDLGALPGFRGKATRRSLGTWFAGVEAARALRPSKLPPVARPGKGPPSARSWPARFPEAAARLAACRAAIQEISEDLTVPAENLLAPSAVRYLAWEPPAHVDAGTVGDALRARGAREWQIGLTAAALAAALTDGTAPA